MKIVSRKKIKAKIGDKEISVSDYRDDLQLEEIKQEKPSKKLNEYELQYKLDEIIEKKEKLDYIKNIQCLQEQMNVVERYSTTMNLKVKEHYSSVTGYFEGTFQWKYYCLLLLELVKNGWYEFCRRFLKENHIAEKTESEYKLYCQSKKDEGWNITKDIISQHYDDGLLTLNRAEYFQKAGMGLRSLYNDYMDSIFNEVRSIAIKYQKQSDDLHAEIKEMEASLILQCDI